MGISQELINPENATAAEDFECVICREFVLDPRVCFRCKKLFCSPCITEWLEKNERCPFKCSAERMDLTDVSDEQLERYVLIQLKCTKRCGEFVSLIEYKDHLATCDLSDCPNHANCNRKACYFYKGAAYCSYLCYKTLKYGREKAGRGEAGLWKLCQVASNALYRRAFPLKFAFDKSSPSFSRTGVNSARLIQGAPEFHTLVCRVGFVGGFGRIRFLATRSDFHLKLGVTSDPHARAKGCSFSDFPSGFAYHTIGQTRNDSNESGLLFGEPVDLRKNFVVEMEINMGEGKLIFSLDGKNLGHAFEEPALTKGPLYPAVACGKNIEEIKIMMVL